MRWLISAGVALALGGTVSVAHAAVDPQRLIVPGKSMGPVVLGTHLKDVVAVLGVPTQKTYLDADHVLAQWQKSALTVALENDTIVLVSTSSRRYQTSTGLRVGMAGSSASEYFPRMVAPSAKGIYGLGDENAGINFVWHPADGSDPASAALPPDWTIDEINVFYPVTVKGR